MARPGNCFPRQIATRGGRISASATRVLKICLGLCLLCGLVLGQAGRRQQQGGGVLLNVVLRREDNSGTPITSRQLALFDNGVQQDIRNLARDPSPARIVVLVDNSLTIPADIQKLEDAAIEFVYEIYEGDKLLIVGYEDEADIVADWTDDAKAVKASLRAFHKKGEPHLFDALYAVADQALRPVTGTKRVIVVVSDGLDRGSKTSFEQTLATLQTMDITVYMVQAQDRTRGAIRRDVPKPKQVVEKLVEGTGGLTFPISEPRQAASTICDELRKSRYVLSYLPSSTPYGETRRLLVLGDQGIVVRAKNMQPPN